jgi:hypothetical protein
VLVPDKRYCFDALRPLTSPGAIIDANLESRKRHRGTVFDNYAYFCVNGDKTAWGVSDEFTPHLQHSDLACITAYSEATRSEEYYDCHSWVFTPSSFQFLVRELRSGTFIELGIDEIQSTQGFEFLSVLSKNAGTTGPSKLDLLLAIQAETGSGDHSEVENLRAQLAEKTAELTNIRASRSWRITQPLRGLTTALRRTPRN